MPGFWDPRRRPERPDLTRITHHPVPDRSRLSAVRISPGANGAPQGFNVDLARMICEELKLVCSIQMRRFDTFVPSLNENRGDAVDRLDRGDATDAGAAGFQRSLLPHAGTFRCAQRQPDRDGGA